MILAAAVMSGHLLVQGEAHSCDCRHSIESHYSWSYPIVELSSEAATRAETEAVKRDVMQALGIKTLKQKPCCHCAGREVDKFSDDDHCELTYVSKHYIALRCSTEGVASGRGASSYRSIVLQISETNAKTQNADQLFTDSGRRTVMKFLKDFVTDERNRGIPTGGAVAWGPEGMIDDTEIPGLVDQMFRSVVLTPDGLSFIVLGSHHSVFETTMPAAHAFADLRPDVAEDLRSSRPTAMAGHFLARSVIVAAVEHRYQIWLPAGYDAAREWPAILFLHGSGERGDDGEKQMTIGLGRAIRDGKVDAQAIVVFPQCPDGQRWVGAPRKIAIAALDATEREFSVDRNRVALTGMSMGGAGAWILAADYPKRWSALAPVCAYVHRPPSLPDADNPTSESFDEFARRVPRIPIWIFHGSDDPVVPVTESREMARALGVTAAYTEFAHTGHNAWDPAYTQTHVVDWLVNQRRQRKPSE